MEAPAAIEATATATPSVVRLPPAQAMIGGLTLARWRQLVVSGGIVIALVLPFVVGSFSLFQLTLAIVYALAILGLNLLTGFNGQFSLGHSAFYAIGAYTAAIMMDHWNVDYYWTLPVAGVVCLVSGFLFGLPALRLEGIYLALATFALAIAAPQILKFSPLEPWTGGVQGIVVIKPDAPFGLPLNSDQWIYFFTLAVAAVLYVCAVSLVNSRTGRAMKAIRDNAIAAGAMGVNVSLYKSLTFGVSALYTGIAGALGAVVAGFVAPDSFTFVLSIQLFVGLVVGGVGSIPGTLFGGLFALYAPNIAEFLLSAQVAVLNKMFALNIAVSVAKGLAGAVYGVILLLVIYVMPSGAAGLVRLIVSKLARSER